MVSEDMGKGQGQGQFCAQLWVIKNGNHGGSRSRWTEKRVRFFLDHWTEEWSILTIRAQEGAQEGRGVREVKQAHGALFIIPPKIRITAQGWSLSFLDSKGKGKGCKNKTSGDLNCVHTWFTPYSPSPLKVWSLDQHTGIPRELTRNAEPRAPPQTHWVSICPSTKSPRWFTNIKISAALLKPASVSP